MTTVIESLLKNIRIFKLIPDEDIDLKEFYIEEHMKREYEDYLGIANMFDDLDETLINTLLDDIRHEPMTNILLETIEEKWNITTTELYNKITEKYKCNTGYGDLTRFLLDDLIRQKCLNQIAISLINGD